MAPFDRPYTTFYWSATINIALSCTVFELFDVEYYYSTSNNSQTVQDKAIVTMAD